MRNLFLSIFIPIPIANFLTAVYNSSEIQHKLCSISGSKKIVGNSKTYEAFPTGRIPEEVILITTNQYL